MPRSQEALKGSDVCSSPSSLLAQEIGLKMGVHKGLTGQELAELPGTDGSQQQRGRGEDAAAPQAPHGASPRAGSPGKAERSHEHKTQAGLSIPEVEEENPKCLEEM